jgi:hypothetical protein
MSLVGSGTCCETREAAVMRCTPALSSIRSHSILHYMYLLVILLLPLVTWEDSRVQKPLRLQLSRFRRFYGTPSAPWVIWSST